MKQADHSILEMALVGYAEQCRQIETAIAALRIQLGGRSTKAAASITTDGAKPTRRLSTAARKRIAAAQKKRWAAFHANAKAAPAKKTAVRKQLSPDRKAALVANLAKARAAKAAKAAAAA